MAALTRMKSEGKCGRAWRLALVALLLGGLTIPAAAESKWDKLSRVFVGSAPTRQEASAAPTAERPVATAPTALPAVTDESGGGAGQTAAQGTAVATLQPVDYGKVAAAPAAPEQQNLFGRESDESENMLASDLFKKPEILQLLGKEPRFVYNPANRPDPMLVPWVRRAVIFKELSAQAEACLQQGKIDEAVTLFQRILDLKDPRFNAVAQERLSEIAMQAQNKTAATAAAQAVEVKMELPAWVRDNTSGVIVESSGAICLVGEHMLRVGDVVPDYPDIKVASIAAKRVVYQIRDQSFEVKLDAPAEPAQPAGKMLPVRR